MFAFRDYKYTKKTGKATLCRNFYPNRGLFSRFAEEAERGEAGDGCGRLRLLTRNENEESGCGPRSSCTSRTRENGPSPPKTAARCGSSGTANSRSRFRITDRAAACGVRASSAANCGPPPPGGCGPHGPDGPIPNRDKPAAERTGLRLWRSRPPPGDGCGLPTSATSQSPQSTSETSNSRGLPVAQQPLYRQPLPS